MSDPKSSRDQKKSEIEEALKGMHPDNPAALGLRKIYRELEIKEKLDKG